MFGAGPGIPPQLTDPGIPNAVPVWLDILEVGLKARRVAFEMRSGGTKGREELVPDQMAPSSRCKSTAGNEDGQGGNALCARCGCGAAVGRG